MGLAAVFQDRRGDESSGQVVWDSYRMGWGLDQFQGWSTFSVTLERLSDVSIGGVN